MNHYLAKKNQSRLKTEPVKLKIESLSEKSKSDTKQTTQWKQINLKEVIKPLWLKLSRSEVLSLVKDVVNNLDSKDYQTTTSNNRYDLKNAE